MKFIKRYWIVICSILVIGFFGFFLHKNFLGHCSSPPEKLGETVGKSLCYALVVFFAASFLRKRWGRKKLEFWILCFSISFSLCATYEVIKINKQTYCLNNYKQELIRLARDSAPSSSSKTSNSYTTEKCGDLAELLPIIKHAAEFSEKMAADIAAACNDLENVLTPSYLREYENILQAKEKVIHFLDIINQCEIKYYEEMALMESKIHTAFLGKENLKKQALAGFEKGKQLSSELISEYFQVERNSTQKIKNVLDFLSSKSGTFWEADDIFFFQKDEDAALYIDLLQQVVDQGKEEDIIVQKLEAYRQSAFQRIEDLDQN